MVINIDFEGKNWSLIEQFCWPWICCFSSVYKFHLIQILQDTKQFAYSFQTETPIKRGVFSHQDRDLLDRIIAQVRTN